MNKIKIKDKILNVEIIIKPSNKHMYLRVKNDTIVITSPTKISENRLKLLVEQHFDKLIKPNKEVSDKIHYLGKEYNIIIKKSNNDLVYINDNNLIIETTNTTFKYANKLTEQFYNNTLKNIVEIYLNNIKKDFNISYEVSFEYKYFKSIFGRCYIKENKIELSSKLAKYDLKYILLIIYHEFAHFKVPNHQKQFYNHVSEKYPNYRKVQNEFHKIKYYELFLR